MQKVELTKQEALLVMRMLNYFLIAQSNNATHKSDVAGADSPIRHAAKIVNRISALAGPVGG